MKKNITLILFFILIFTGVALLGYTPALAAKPTAGEYMTACSDTETDAGICAEYETTRDDGTTEIVAWVVRPWIKRDDVDPPINRAVGVEDLGIGNGWPWLADGVYHYGYQGGLSSDYWTCYKVDRECGSLSAASYTVTVTNAAVSGSYPSGAFMNPDNLSVCEGLNVGGALQPWKLNPDMTFRHQGYWEVETATDLIDETCGQIAVLFSSDCWTFPMVTALGDQVAAYESETTRTCGDVVVQIDWDQCTLKPKNVKMFDMDYTTTPPPPPIPLSVCHTRTGGADHPWFSIIVNGQEFRWFEAKDCGPQQGCLLCTGIEHTDALGPLFMHGNDAYRGYRDSLPDGTVCLP